jgi:cobalt-precorrin 5A hydrolase
MNRELAVLVITPEGFGIGKTITLALKAELHIRQGIEPNVAEDIRTERFSSLGEHIKKIFSKYRGLVFVMSLGIVNRVIAPCLKDKYTDPAVVTVDEVGRFVISTLSGHEGGANELTYLVSSITGAEPVVTTATEASRLYICGVGCRRGEDGERVLSAIKDACAKAGIKPSELRCIASAWIKKDEEAIRYAGERLGLYIRFLPRWLIDHYYRVNPHAECSQFVYKKIGVYGVAEPSAMLSGRNTVLQLCKNYNRVKVAIAREVLFQRI